MNVNHLLLQALSKGIDTPDRIQAWILNTPSKGNGWHVQRKEFYYAIACQLNLGHIEFRPGKYPTAYRLTERGQDHVNSLIVKYNAYYG